MEEAAEPDSLGTAVERTEVAEEPQDWKAELLPSYRMDRWLLQSIRRQERPNQDHPQLRPELEPVAASFHKRVVGQEDDFRTVVVHNRWLRCRRLNSASPSVRSRSGVSRDNCSRLEQRWLEKVASHYSFHRQGPLLLHKAQAARWKALRLAEAERSSGAAAARTARNGHASNSTKVVRTAAVEEELDRWRNSTSRTHKSAALAEQEEERSTSTELPDCAACAEQRTPEAAGGHDSPPEVDRIALDIGMSSLDELEAAKADRAEPRDSPGIAVADTLDRSGEGGAVDNASRIPEQPTQKNRRTEVQSQLVPWPVDDNAEREAGPELREGVEMDNPRKTREVGREQEELTQRSGRVSRPQSWRHRY